MVQVALIRVRAWTALLQPHARAATPGDNENLPARHDQVATKMTFHSVCVSLAVMDQIMLQETYMIHHSRSTLSPQTDEFIGIDDFLSLDLCLHHCTLMSIKDSQKSSGLS